MALTPRNHQEFASRQPSYRSAGMVLALAAVAAVGLAGCGSHPHPKTASAKTSSAASASTVATPSLPASQPSANAGQYNGSVQQTAAQPPADKPTGSEGGIAVALRTVGAPTGCRKSTDGPLLFDVTVTDSGVTDYKDLAAVVTADQYPGGAGPLHVLSATLERQDPANGTWQQVTMPVAANSQALSANWPTVSLAHQTTITFRYRLTPADHVGAGNTQLHVYALHGSDHRTLAQTTQPLCFA